MKIFLGGRGVNCTDGELTYENVVTETDEARGFRHFSGRELIIQKSGGVEKDLAQLRYQASEIPH